MFTGKQANQAENKSGGVKGKTPFFSSFVQAKLQVNEPADSYEHEADAMADHVMRMSNPSQLDASFFKPAITGVQRKCQHCEEEEKLHRKEGSDGEVQESNELDSYVSSLDSSGQSLPESSRMFFEPRFGRDFSSVRVHTDTAAAQSAQSINALAYTTGNNIVFNSGQFSPESDSGKRLMAHELTHVVQQGNDKVARLAINPDEQTTPTQSHAERPPEASAYIPPWIESLAGPVPGVQRKAAASLSNSHGGSGDILIQRTGGATCPTTCNPGTAPPYVPVSDPSFNCYAYAVNSPGSGFLQPGQRANTHEFQLVRSGVPPATAADRAAVIHYFTPDGVLQNATADLGPPAFSRCDGCCPVSKRKIIGVATAPPLDPLTLRTNWDFHWYRKDADRGWSNKHGGTDSDRADAAGVDPICNPCTSSRNFGVGLNYVNVVGAWCV